MSRCEIQYHGELPSLIVDATSSLLVQPFGFCGHLRNLDGDRYWRFIVLVEGLNILSIYRQLSLNCQEAILLSR